MAQVITQALRKATEALEFYADIESWEHIAPGRAIYTVILDDIGDGDYDNGNGTDDMSVGGLRARSILTEIEALASGELK